MHGKTSGLVLDEEFIQYMEIERKINELEVFFN